MSNKAKQGAQKQIVDDKTFGLKNKNKSKKVQMYVKQVVASTKASFTDKKKETELEKKNAEKAEKKRRKEEIAELFKQSIVQPKVPFGVDPKTIACEYFKAGQCTKTGDKCKFSHDQTICFGRKKAVTNKIDLCVDVQGNKAEEDIAITDPVELQKAIEKKAKQMACETHIVCKHFLGAIEEKKYGWFWECPDNQDGKTCKYRHALPPGYVFKDKKKKSGDEDDEEGDGLTLEERLDQMRKGVGPGAMVTAETFKEWKEARRKKKEEEEEAKAKAAQKGYKKGGKTNMTGRQLFEFDSSIFVDDAEASGSDTYKKEFEDAEQALLAKNTTETAEPAPAEGDRKLTVEEAEAAAEVALPEGIEENLFLDEDLDDLPSDDD